MSMDLVTAFVRDSEHALEPYPPTDGGVVVTTPWRFLVPLGLFSYFKSKE